MPEFYTKDGEFVSFESAEEREERLMWEADDDGRGTVFNDLTSYFHTFPIEMDWNNDWNQIY